MIFLEKLKSARLNRGMTYVELIVVLGIFATMSAVAIFNYGSFQAKIDIRNLANDIALKIVQAQKDASLGKLPITVTSDAWKPSYGVHVALGAGNFNPDNNIFYRFVDLDAGKTFTAPAGCLVGAGHECLEQVTIGKNNYIDSISLVGENCVAINTFVVTFTRPNLAPTIITNPLANCAYSGVKMVVKSPRGNTSAITINTSGKVEIN